MRLIDAISFRGQLIYLANHMQDNGYSTYAAAVGEIISVLDRQQAIDAVPVVRCKDCRYSEPMKKHGVSKFGENALNCTMCRGDDGYGYTGISVIRPDDYCSDGALKDGDADESE